MLRLLFLLTLTIATCGAAAAQSRLKVNAGLTTGYENNLFRGPDVLQVTETEVLSAPDLHTNAWLLSPEVYTYLYRRYGEHRLTVRGKLAADWFPFFEIASRHQAKAEVQHAYQLSGPWRLTQEAGWKYRRRWSEEGLPFILSFPYNYRYAYYAAGPEARPFPGNRSELLLRVMHKKMSDEDLKELRFVEAGLRLRTRQQWSGEGGEGPELDLDLHYYRRFYQRASPLFDPDEDGLVISPEEAALLTSEEDFTRHYWQAELTTSLPLGRKLRWEGGLRYKGRFNPADPRFNYNSWKPEIELTYESDGTEIGLDASFLWKRYRELVPAGLDRPVQYGYLRLDLTASRALFPGVRLLTSIHYNRRDTNADRRVSLAFRSFQTWGFRMGFLWEWEKYKKAN